jgi:hypothetical protein
MEGDMNTKFEWLSCKDEANSDVAGWL